MQGVTRALVEALYIKNLLRVHGQESKIDILTDSTAAERFTNRLGVGKRMRHLETQEMFAQQFVREGSVKIVKVKGKLRPPDAGTEYLSKEDMTRLLKLIDVKLLSYGAVAGSGRGEGRERVRGEGREGGRELE